MIRLLSIQPVAERGGSDQALVRMLRSLPSDEFDCHVVVPAEPPLREQLEAVGVDVHIIPMRRISTSHGALAWLAYALAWPITVLRLARLVRRLRVDVVHTNSLHSWYGWAAARLARRPHVWHAREITVQSNMALRVERFLTRRYADRVISMSYAIADKLDARDIVVIHETADADEFNPQRAGNFRRGVGIPDDVLLIGAAGRIDSWKGIDVLLDAFEQLRAVRPDPQLVIVGGPVAGKEELYQSLEARAAGIPGAHWIGARSDMPDVLADLDLFVLPSTEPEPYGLVLVEALASGVPVVATDAGGPPEIVADARWGGGRLVPPRNVPALVDAISAALRETPATSTAARAARPTLRDPEPDRFAEVFRTVVELRAR